MDDILLKVEGLQVFFYQKGEKVLCVNSIDIDVCSGKTHCIVGESGSGKSVTALSIMGLIPPEVGGVVGGSIRLEGQELLVLNDKQLRGIRGNRIAMIFQEPMTSLNPIMTIGEQLTEGYIYHSKVSKQEAEKKAIDILKIIGLSNTEKLMKQYPHNLSGGMRQRVMIAIALMCDPCLLIADEPTTALDVTIQAQILRLLQRLKEKTNMSMIFITHDMGVVREIADFVHVCYAGQFVEVASVKELFEFPMHPYTRALLNTIPSIEDNGTVLASIPGTVPAPKDFPLGCRFANRCSYTSDTCLISMPEMLEVRPGHLCRCPFATSYPINTRQ